MESNGRIPEAIEHYVKAGEFEPAATLLEKISESLLHSGNWHNLSGWIDSLPQDILDEHPWLLVYEAWIVNEEGDPGKALELCHQTQKSFRRTGNSLGITWTRLTMGLAFRRKGLLDEAIDICQLALSHMPENSVDTRLQADVLKHLGLSLYQAGEFEDAIEHLTQALRTYELQGDIYGTAEVHDVLGQIHGLRGRHHDALSHLEAARQGYRRLNNRKSYSEVLNNIGVVYHKQGHLDLSREALQEALDEARRSSNLKPEAYCLASLGDLNRDAGNMPAALRTYEGALEKAVTAELAPLVPYLTDAIATVYRLEGHLERAEIMARQSLYPSERLEGLEQGLYSRSLGAILCEMGRFEEAATLLARACTLLGHANVPEELAKAEFMFGYLCLRANKQEDCDSHLNKVVRLLERTQNDTFLLAEARSRPELVEHALSRGIGERWFYLLRQRVRSSRFMAEEATNGVDGAKYPEVYGYTLGTCKVVMNGQEVPRVAWHSKNAIQLLIYLLYEGNELRKEEVIEAIWPDCSMEKGNSSFQSTVYRIRRALYKDAVVERDGRYLLNPKGHWWLDACEFKRLALSASKADIPQETKYDVLEEATKLYKGRFLLDFDSEWVDSTQRELHGLYLSTLTQLRKYYMKQGRYEDAVRTSTLVLQEEQYNDEALHDLMDAQNSLGNRDDALRAYRNFDSLVTRPV